MNMNIKTMPWDAADHLRTEQDIVAYLEAAFEEGDSRLIAAALGDVARFRGMSRAATDAGLGRESLHEALRLNGNVDFATILRVLGALGISPRPYSVERSE